MGFVWFGTRDGLNRYDGHNFSVYKHDNADSNSISSNDIIEIVAGAGGDLWIGTFRGLNRYDYSRNKFISFLNDAKDSTSLSDNAVWSVCSTKSGTVWVGTASGLNRYDQKRKCFERFYHDPADENSISDNLVLDILEDRAGNIWLATARGLNKATVDAKGAVNFERFYHQSEGGFFYDNFTQTIVEDREGNLWLGTKYGGLLKFDTHTATFEAFVHDPLHSNSISHNDVRSLAFDEKGLLWVGTYHGLNLLEPRSGRIIRILNDKNNPASLSKNAIKSIFLDRKNTVWVGTYYGGINMLDSQYHNFRNYVQSTHGLRFDVVSAMVEDKQGNVYVGTEGGGISLFNPRNGSFSLIGSQYENGEISSKNIKSLYLDDKQKLWIGTFNAGLNILDLQSGEIEYFSKEAGNLNTVNDNNIYAIVQQNDSLFWLGTHGGGLSLYNRESRQFTHIKEGTENGLSSNFVRTLYIDSGGNLWAGTQAGLNFLSAENLRMQNLKFKTYFSDQKKLQAEDIHAIYEDSHSRIWVGTYNSGLNRYDAATDSFVNIKLQEPTGNSSNVVHGILEDKGGSLWISTNQGILSYDPESNQVRRFLESDGLVSNEFNNNSCLETSTGHMYFGSLQGLTLFHPDSIRINQYAPPVVLTDFRLFGKSVQPGDDNSVLQKVISHTQSLSLDYDEAIFTIEFSIPNFINPDKNHYAYRLKGLEEAWNYTSANTATYTIQQPGTYTFEVKGANNDDVWHARPTTLTVTVNPAPWKTWWAFTGYALVILVSLYLLINIIWSRSRLRHELELEHISKERQEALNQMKLQFFTNISHEFRTPLTLILGPLEQIMSNFRGSNALYKQLQAIEQNAERMRLLIDQLMDFRKFENNHLQLKAAEGNIVAFVQEVYLSFKQYADLHGVVYEFKSEASEMRLWYDRDKLERVIFNLISNAFKYTADNGHIQIEVKQVEGSVEIAVVDNGIGMAPEHLDKIFERFYEIEETDNFHKSKYRKGTGIGLALAKGIVDLHAGKIRVESRLHAGSTFTVSLPQGKDHLREDQIISDFRGSDDLANYQPIAALPASFAAASLQIPELPKDAPTVLVVEDNAEIRNFLVQLFRQEYNVIEAGNGREGMAEAVQHEPDIIISDVMMPVMDGIAFCQQLKSNIKTSHIPVILLTARTSLIFKYEGLEMGADDYINKPFNVKELRLKVRNLISARKKLKDRFTSDAVIKPGDITVSSLDEKLLERALKIVEENISNEHFNISAFSEELGVSRTMLFTKVKAWTNLTPNDFLLVMRMKRAAQLLEQNKLNVAQVGFQVGFKNPKYFSKCFQRHFSETPTSYARRFSSPDEVMEQEP
ncbi:hybrid sensor histidine kinase/response regulator transcription factor [Cesiribacter sp. SM1]|uniref:hybrid sensor histidine kinase/response regulator transcription factor n=1 Tax=Cesiribacter sp. SM1 TaxID=2861196 RepID=UPI001CD5C684|nr:hybrid sensor histidine kinase/response regulator transcription factor [Cesiribacter sp. SM1]